MDSQARTVEEFDVFLNQDLFDKSKGELEAFVKEAPKDAEGFTVVEGGKAIKASTPGLYFKSHTHPYTCRTLDYLPPS